MNSGLSNNKTSSGKWLIALTFQGRCPRWRKLISFVVNFRTQPSSSNQKEANDVFLT